jgi:hypothetical protein
MKTREQLIGESVLLLGRTFVQLVRLLVQEPTQVQAPVQAPVQVQAPTVAPKQVPKPVLPTPTDPIDRAVLLAGGGDKVGLQKALAKTLGLTINRSLQVRIGQAASRLIRTGALVEIRSGVYRITPEGEQLAVQVRTEDQVSLTDTQIQAIWRSLVPMDRAILLGGGGSRKEIQDRFVSYSKQELDQSLTISIGRSLSRLAKRELISVAATGRMSLTRKGETIRTRMMP